MSVMMNTSSIFATSEWSALPFTGRKKQAVQLLADIHFAIPLCLEPSGRKCTLAEFFDEEVEDETIRGSIFGQATRLLSLLDIWWQDFKKSPLRDPHNTITISTYHATRLIVHLILHVTSITGHPRVNSTSHSRSATSHATSILEITASLESRRPISFDYMRTTFALGVVALLSPNHSQKADAGAILQRWETT